MAVGGGFVSQEDLEYFAKRLCQNAWSLQGIDDTGLHLAYGYTSKTHGEFMYQIIVRAPVLHDSRSRLFERAVLIGPLYKPYEDVCNPVAILHEWKTYRGVNNGIQAMFDRRFREFKYFIKKYAFSGGSYVGNFKITFNKEGLE